MTGLADVCAEDGQAAARDRKWQVVRLDFTTKNTIFNATQTPIAFVNPGPSVLWIDAVSLAEMK